MSTPTVLLVMKSPGNIRVMSQALDAIGLRARPVAAEHDLERDLHQMPPPELALIDTAGFDHLVWKLCERLRERNVPFLVLCSLETEAVQALSRANGAAHVLRKPVAKSALLQLLKALRGGGEQNGQ